MALSSPMKTFSNNRAFTIPHNDKERGRVRELPPNLIAEPVSSSQIPLMKLTLWSVPVAWRIITRREDADEHSTTVDPHTWQSIGAAVGAHLAVGVNQIAWKLRGFCGLWLPPLRKPPVVRSIHLDRIYGPALHTPSVTFSPKYILVRQDLPP